MTQWILLRGLTRDNRHWGRFPDDFRAAMPDVTVSAIDLPGNGARYRETSPWSIAEMVEDCRQSMRQLAIDQPVCLLAMSLGAMVAVEWASRYPDEIKHCVLINTSARCLSPFYRRLRPQNYGRLLIMGLIGSAETWESSVLAMTSQGRAPKTLQRWVEFHRQYPVSKANALRQLVAAARYRPAEKPPGDCLLLASTQDQLVNVACSRALAARWQLKICEHPTAGHDLPLDDGAWVIAQIKQWLNGAVD